MNQLFKRLLMALLILGLASSAGWAQRFVYLQTADQTPFYIQLGGKTYSSTAAGYLLLGKLADSVYPIRLGVLGSTDVQEYGLRVAGKDAGYYIKKSGEQQAWTLTNMLTGEAQFSLEYTSAQEAEKARQDLQAEAQRRADSTANAQAVARRADSVAAATAAAEKTVSPVVPVAAAEQITAVPTAPATTANASDSSRPAAVAAVPAQQAPNATQARADSLARIIAEKEKELKELQAALAAAGTKKDPAPVVVPLAVGLPSVPKIGSVSAEKSPATAPAAAGQPALLDMEFAMPGKDSTAPVARGADSVVASPPARVRDVFGGRPAVVPAVAADSVASLPAAVTANLPTDTVKPAVPADVAKPIDTLKTDTKTAPSDTALAAPKATEKIKRTPCSSLLDRDQLNQLQVQAARLIDKDEIIALYKKAFASNCITTSNLRRIVNGLASDVARYKLLEAAYPYTLDYYEFGNLSTLLTDTYYLNQFKTLLSQ